MDLKKTFGENLKERGKCWKLDNGGGRRDVRTGEVPCE